ncbi:type II toxin-antitoxin system PemK/MazF family toxin [Leptolinea tardivitalis]|uniref:type II toxin-antitoxin system PemK/MazF family toxin n=1 Tax=Leptolinea tardivitalis TaxID=229920 RepID=UPI00191C56EE|nr:type II toxin-antitoxin system PemK/MazF family toxin [Leptolinea tardivitalis]
MDRGEIWLINFDPTIGAEIKKTCPVAIVSSNAIGKLPLRIVVPPHGLKIALPTSTLDG